MNAAAVKLGIFIWKSAEPIKRIKRALNRRRVRKGKAPLEIREVEEMEMGEQIESMVRSVGKMIAGALVAQGIISDSLVEPLIGVAVALATMVWSYVAHRKPAKPE